MYIHIQSESERIPTAIRYAEKQIEELNQQLSSLNYIELPNGELVVDKFAYSEEKRQIMPQIRQWEIMLSILKSETPFGMNDF